MSKTIFFYSYKLLNPFDMRYICIVIVKVAQRLRIEILTLALMLTFYLTLQWFPALRGVAAAQEESAKKAATEAVIEGLMLLEDVFKNCSKGNKFFGGDKIGYLDIALGCFLGWLKVTEKLNNITLLDESKTPCLYKWAEDFCADSSVKDVMPETDKLLEAAKALLPKIRADASS